MSVPPRSARYRIEHETHYVYTSGVSTSQHLAWLTPRELPWQQVSSQTLSVTPAPAQATHRVDYFGNGVDQFTLLTPHDELHVSSRSRVEVSARPLAPGDGGPPWEQVATALSHHPGRPLHEADEFRSASPYIVLAPELAAFARISFTPGRGLVAAALDLIHRVHEGFRFDPLATTIATPVTRVLAERHGVCQDFAHLAIACLRSIGLSARYVSGYLLTDPPPGQPRLIGADASHAWLSIHCPGHGWIDLDPTNDVVAGLRHVTLAWGRDYGDVTPLRGVILGGSEHALRVGVSVVPEEGDGG